MMKQMMAQGGVAPKAREEENRQEKHEYKDGR